MYHHPSCEECREGRRSIDVNHTSQLESFICSGFRFRFRFRFRIPDSGSVSGFRISWFSIRPPVHALHSEMRNTEQLLGSLGLFAYRCNALEECNKAISPYGPELSRGHDRITVKLRKGQQTGVNKNNILVASFSGKTYF